MVTPTHRLEELLGRAWPVEQPLADDKQPGGLILYGAGNLGRRVLSRLRASGIEPLAFADDTPAKQGSTIDGLPVVFPEEVCPQFGNHVTVAVTILNSAMRFLEAREQLHTRTGCEAISLLELSRMYPDSLLPYLQYDRPEQITRNAQPIRRAFHTLADQRSRQEFVAHLEFRLTANYDVLPGRSQPPYFPADLISQFASDVTFVDCGAYDGDTVRAFLAHQGDRFDGIVAFEPDEQNYEKLMAYVSSLEAKIRSRIQLHRGAVGDQSGTVAFTQTGDMSAAVAVGGNEQVPLFALDGAILRAGSQIYLKLDIEGFELPALRGAAHLLRSKWSALAVSAYHLPADLWEIPLYLHDLDLGHRLYLRTEGEDGMDIVCYAIPRDQLKPGTLA